MSQRKNYFVAKGMQSKFVLTLLLLLFLVAVITICNVYVIFEFVLKSTPYASEDSTRDLMNTLREGAGSRLVLIGLVNIIIVAIIGVFYSHQFAGPSYKLERSIRQIASGDLSLLVTLRKSDAMHEIAESLNLMVNKYREVFVKANELNQRLRETVDTMAADHEGLSKEVAVLRGICAEQEDLLAGIKIHRSAPKEGEPPEEGAPSGAPPAGEDAGPSREGED